ncbi:hypothetical protein ACN20G_30295 (plasmid) [Streptomyces sp. BI20]|uniref:hypothetical protein n=1 Tax=Streptomyces sp. BI20 TaxID=3403460 RepID=UPI003C78A6F4
MTGSERGAGAGAFARRVFTAVPALAAGAVLAMVAGLLLGVFVDPGSMVSVPLYLTGTSLLLGVGLFGSVQGIDPGLLRADLRGVVAAVTLGVVLKAALITAVLWVFFDRPAYLVLGIAVAQIDPLSVAALGRAERMSERARSLLTAWASFDDPVTVLLTLYAAGWAWAVTGRTGDPAVAAGGAGGWLGDLALNGALFAGTALLWWAGRWALRAASGRRGTGGRGRRVGRGGEPVAVSVFAGLLLVALLVVAAGNALLLAVALAGLVVRTPVLAAVVGRAVSVAYLAAFGALGLFLARGVEPVPGLVLGLAAFGAQAVVVWGVLPFFVRGLERRDRVLLGVAQQNGITAVLIALALEPDFPGTVAVVGPAVVTVNVLHVSAGALLARRERHRARSAHRDGPPGDSPPPGPGGNVPPSPRRPVDRDPGAASAGPSGGAG